jgi:hypothetical protein
LAALESSWSGTSSLAFTVHQMLLGIALVGAIVNRGSRRTFRFGSAVFAWSYSLVAFGFLFPGRTYNSNVWWGSSEVSPTRNDIELFTSHLLNWYRSLRVQRDVGNQCFAGVRLAGGRAVLVLFRRSPDHEHQTNRLNGNRESSER